MCSIDFAPVCLFVYNRLSETIKTLEELKNNVGATDTDLFIFSDAAKNENSLREVNEVRQYINNISGFRNITIVEREENFGLAKSIITGVSFVFKKYEKVIVLEDDLITSRNFLTYMNQALSFYESSSKVWSISGFSFPITYPHNYEFDNAFGVRASSWGWATWKDRWDLVDWDVSDYAEFKSDKLAKTSFNAGGSDLCKMLDDQMTGRINSWAIRFCYSQFRHQCYDVFPCVSKIQNIGFSGNASHTKGMGHRFHTVLDKSENMEFKFSSRISIDSSVLSQFKKPFSVIARIKYKLISFFK
jgi:hypothetical protein